MSYSKIDVNLICTAIYTLFPLLAKAWLVHLADGRPKLDLGFFPFLPARLPQREGAEKYCGSRKRYHVADEKSNFQALGREVAG